MLVALEDVASIDFVEDIVEGGVIAVGNDGIGLFLEGGEVVDDTGTEEGLAILEGGLVDDDIGTLRLHTLHDALDGTLAEIVGVALHGETEDTNGDLLLGTLTPVAIGGIVAGLTQHLVSDKVLAGAVALDNGGHHILGHIGIVGKELFGVLGQTVAAIAKRGVVIVGTDTGVETYSGDDGLRVETLDLGIGVEFIEIANTQGEIGVGKELHGLGLGHAHQETRDTLVK